MGLQSYTEEQASIFYGRDAEIEKLTALIHSNTLTIVFGKSGTGKTSLLNAGVFPRLHKNYCLPFRIRLNFNEDSPGLIEQIKNVLKTEIDKYGFKVKSYPGKETLWEYFHKEPLWKSITPILIFDQFEEIFTLAGKNPNLGEEDMKEFWEVLSNLAENSIPQSLREHFLDLENEVGYNYKKQKVKIVFAFREEYLPEFESISKIIPSIKTSRFRLMPMNGHQAMDVITKTWGNKIAGSEARLIVSYLTKDAEQNNYDLMVIEPSLLSQVCAYIDKERIAKGVDTVSSKFLADYPKETILRSIYNEAVAAAALMMPGYSADNNKSPNPVKVFLEEKLITSEGYRNRYTMGPLDEPVRPGLNVLMERYFVREDDKNVELTHDVLTPLIKTDREKRRKKQGQEKIKHRALAIAAFLLLLLAGAAAFTYTSTVSEAKKEKAKLENENKLLHDQFLSDSLRLENTRQQLKDNEKKLKDLNKQAVDNPSILTDSAYLALMAETDSLNVMLVRANQAYKALQIKGQEQEDRLNEISRFLGTSNVISSVQAIQSRLDDSKYRHDSLLDEFYRLKNKYAALQKNYNATNDLLNKYRPYPLQVINEGPVDTTNALQLDLYYSLPQAGLDKPAKNTTVFLIPYKTGTNKKIIRKAKLYEVYCNESDIGKADGLKTARYANGKFVFENVGPGEYFVKICGYYGGYESISKAKEGAVTVRLDASPPIR